MKKTISVLLLIALCCVAVFATDVAAKVKVYMSYSDKGYSFGTNKGTWEPNIALSANGEKAGAAMNFALTDFESIEMEHSVWFKPGFNRGYEKLKVDIGAHTEISFKDGLLVKDFISYGKATLTEGGDDNYMLGFGYKPKKDSKDADVFFAGQINYLKDSTASFNLGVVTKFNKIDGELSYNYAQGFAIGSYGSVKYDMLCSKDNFGLDESVYLNRRSYWYEQEFQPDSYSTTFTAGIKFRNFAEQNKEKDNGLYGYIWGSYCPDGAFYYEAEAEVGRHSAQLELESRGSKDAFSDIVYAMGSVDWYDGEAKAKLEDIYIKLTKTVDGYNPYFKLHYYNKDFYSAESNGLYIVPGLTGSVGACGYEISSRLGVDATKKFRWSVDSNYSVGF